MLLQPDTTHINASVQEIEKFIKKLLPHTEIWRTETTDHSIVGFQFKDKTMGGVTYGGITLEITKGGVLYTDHVNKESLYSYFNGSSLEYERMKDYYEVGRKKLRAEIMKQFEGDKKQIVKKRAWKHLKRETQKAYSEAWYIYLDMCEEYAGDGLTKPTVSDWQQRVKGTVKKSGKLWQVSERTLETVKAYGGAGDIPKKKRKKT